MTHQLPIEIINGTTFFKDERLHEYREVSNNKNSFSMDDTVTAQLCGCNNCGAIMKDENPDDQPELTVQISLLSYMNKIGLTAEDEPSEDTEDMAWACPVCKTDGYFTDISDDDHLKTFIDLQVDLPEDRCDARNLDKY